MKKLRNLLAMVLAMVMVLSLAACGGAPEAPETTETTAAAETTVPETEAPIPSEPEETEAPEMNEDIFTDSVSQKGAPAIKGKLVIWDMVDDEIDLLEQDKDKVVCEVPAEKLHLIPFAERTETEKDLEDAYNEILNAATLADLDDDMTEAAQESGMDLQKLVVRDLVENY